MAIILLILLAVSVTITLVGVLLSPKFQASQERNLSPTFRARQSQYREPKAVPVPARARRADSIVPSRQLSQRQSPARVLPTTGSSLLDSLNIFSSPGRSTTTQVPWLGIALMLLALSVLGIYALRIFLPNSAQLIAVSWIDSVGPAKAPAVKNTRSQGFPGVLGASQALVRLSQLDPKQYSSQQEYDTWAYSACSAAAMTEVINAYHPTGRQYRVSDILRVENNLGEITPDQGLMEPVGIDRTVARFNFQATWLKNPSLDDLLNAANSGRPVMVSFPPDRWSGGHILVVRGGRGSSVYLADTSRLNMQVMDRGTFLKYWADFAVVVTPR